MKARRNLALIFEANIQSVAEVFESASRQVSSSTGETWEEVQHATDHSVVSTDRMLEASEVVDTWEAPEGEMWALAVINRVERSRVLQDRIEELDRSVESNMEKAQVAPNLLGRIPYLRRALGALAEREALASDLTVLEPGVRLPPKREPSDVLNRLHEAKAQVSVALVVVGQGAEKVADCLENALTKAGHSIETREVDEEASEARPVEAEYDLQVLARVRSESRGRSAGMDVVETYITLRLIDGASNRNFLTAKGSEKASRPSPSSALATAAVRVCQKQVPRMMQEIETTFSR